MSITKSNAITKNYRSKFGHQLVFRNRFGHSVMAIPPKRRKTAPTENQLYARMKFRMASHYATNILQDPDMLAAYTAKSHDGLSPYILAVTDWLNPPFVDQVDASGYNGNPGDRIGVVAGDDFELTAVTVKIVDAAGALIEEGPCVVNMATGNYEFTATVAVPDVAGATITAKATDTPGHTAELSVTL